MNPNPSYKNRRSVQEDPFHPNGWLERLTRLNLQFGRFARDGIGVTLLAIALMILMTTLGLAEGLIISPLSSWLSLWFGWGNLLIIMGIGYLGYSFLRRGREVVRWGRLVGIELASVLTFGLLSALGGNDLIRAESGMDGGRLGWGIVTFFWTLLGNAGGWFALILLWALSIMAGFGLWARLESWLMEYAGDTTAPNPVSAFEADDKKEIHHARPGSAGRKRSQPLPPEFRTSLKGDGKSQERARKPPPRGEDLPPLHLLLVETAIRADERTINQTAGLIMKTLAEFGIPATVIGYRVGPAVTQFAVQPGFLKKSGSDEEDAQLMKVRVAQIAALEKDLALALSAERLRIEAPVPGKPYVGIEVPNSNSTIVRLKSILESDAFYRVGSPLAMAIGRDVSGQSVVADLARMPHLLIAGATGSGKSVSITAIAACLAMNNTPEDLRLIMIDSKMVELIRFNGLPHLYGKVETDLQRILGVLRWVVAEMEHRYRLLESLHARDLEAYNRKISRKAGGKAIPRIVVLVDELADLMMSAPDQTEHNLVRLAQMARATGIHLVVATQRPSTDVVTGLIKANFPARLAFAVASGVDSRVILDSSGAETLLGRGDMLFLNPESGTPVRAQGVMVTDMEIERIIAHWQKNSDSSESENPPWESLLKEPQEDDDEHLIDQAVSIVRQSQRASASLLQRRLRIGYPRAARLLDQLEERGVVGPSQGGGREREVLVDELDQDENGS
ncbi:MAG: DNA translocase FtsK [Chloroflexi bacterium]|nr:DNA translocase FtsK [Chloroflexota bacterium]